MKKKKGFLYLIFIFVAIVAFFSLMASINKGNQEMFFGDGYELMNENAGQSSTSSISIEISDTSFVGEQTLLNVSSGSSVVVSNCSFSGSQESIIIVQGGELLLDSSTINAQTNLHPIDLKSGKLLLTGNTNITGSSTSNSSTGILVRGNGDNDVLDTTDWTGSISMFSVGIDISAGGGQSISINLSSGTIKNCGTGIRSVNSSATLNISGDGIIRNNEQGVNFVGGEIEMSGGEIYSNYSSGDGGAIRATNLSKLTLSGGTIRNNSSTYSGGGIYLDSAKNVTISGTFKCSENTSVESGGGIYAQYTSPNE